MPHIRIFPHHVKGFPSRDSLTTWLMTCLKARDGEYHLWSANSVAELPAGSVVLFRYANELVGEAVVKRYVREGGVGRSLSGEEEPYEACVWFTTGSIRLFAPPITIEEVKTLIGESPDIKVERGYYIIRDWSVYPKLLALVAQKGSFL